MIEPQLFPYPSMPGWSDKDDKKQVKGA